MRKKILLVACVAPLLTTAAIAEDKHKKATDETEASVKPEEIVSGRRGGFWMSAALMGGMFGVMQSDGDVKGLAFAANALSQWAKGLPGLFPAGSNHETSNALPTVWSDWEGFSATAKLYDERAKKLSEIAKSGDKEAFKAQWKVVRQTCESCHTKYRKKPESGG